VSCLRRSGDRWPPIGPQMQHSLLASLPRRRMLTRKRLLPAAGRNADHWPATVAGRRERRHRCCGGRLPLGEGNIWQGVHDEPGHCLQPPPGQRPKEKWKGGRGRGRRNWEGTRGGKAGGEISTSTRQRFAWLSPGARGRTPSCHCSAGKTKLSRT
jgi:hypothetical protein